MAGPMLLLVIEGPVVEPPCVIGGAPEACGGLPLGRGGGLHGRVVEDLVLPPRCDGTTSTLKMVMEKEWPKLGP